MALPTSNLDLEMIRIEVGLAAPTSLDACLVAAGKARPGAMSDFYGYSHGVGSAPTQSPLLNSPTMGDTYADLTWGSVADATSYEVNYRAYGGLAWTVWGSVTTTSCRVSNLVTGTTYEFRVAGKNSYGTGPWSNIVNGTTGSGGGMA